MRGDEKPRYTGRKPAATKLPAVLTIATTDSSGGAGIPADLKTMLANDVFGECVVAGITAQNTTGVQAIAAVDPNIVGAQIDSVFDDIRPTAVKIGVIVGVESVKTVARKLRDHQATNIVVDPVMVATSGSSLAADDTIAEEISSLFPIATVITPNIPEAQVLAQMPIGNQADMETAAVQLAKDYGTCVLVKGGHGVKDADDVLAFPTGAVTWFEGERVANDNTHGTGCTLSSAIASYLAQGEDLEDAVRDAKAYLSGALRANLNLGKGHGPMDHAWAMH
uniref:bifunctional hydroxymethylpyrimidine kinase/phosphomethylpyrimidine kinase n=1 Tax=Bifidobacterium animalis TaxID=28025 RepID=UPI002AA2ACA7|nr:bifunctional hydroxymethylpyrimidine kinase/phosphomethylpyrimidine kinase [Bifidobacterium animalis]